MPRGAALALTLAFCRAAGASNPLEYPDDGTASFSRGGAWLAVGNEPIAAHYDPAALAIQPNGASLDTNLNFSHTCFSRRGPGDTETGPDVVSSPFYRYRDACEARGAFPFAVPSIAVAFRVSARVGVGIAVVPPATYGTPSRSFPAVANGVDTSTGKSVPLPAPYRYQTLEQQSLVLFPTLGVGWEIARGFRVGAGFVAGIGVINLSTVGVANLGSNDALGDHMTDDSLSSIRTEDLFVPGAILSVHWSVTPRLDIALWGRVMDSIRATQGSVSVTQQAYDGGGHLNPPCAGAKTAAGDVSYADCSGNQAVPNEFPRGLARFEYPIPPEIRWGVRYHAPRSSAPSRDENGTRRDPLVDDVFDVELDQSLTLNAAADRIVVRFPESDGSGSLVTNPTRVPIPPNADRPTGYRNSYGARLGGQWNAIPNLFAIRAGGWFESRSQDPRYLTIQPVGAARFGFGGGVVVRYRFLDVSVGYQRHLTLGLDNHGEGELRAPAAVRASDPFDARREPDSVPAADRREFRTEHAVNGGRVSFDAHVFSIGLVARF
ncbi:MAG TPA: hypothetical protein VHE30_18320 [Polyangiaceae bacterium]|nr:hypothetical protein [Polyangiaceae bacterium]